MKLVTLSLALLLLSVPSFAQANSRLKLVTLKPETVFAPKGFNTNNNVQLVVHGTFHDVCHQIAPVKYSIDLAAHKITIQNSAYTTDICTEMYVSTPYSILLNLGTLPSAKYNILVMDEKGALSSAGTLPVAAAKQGTTGDEFLYAQVDEVQYVKTSDLTRPNLVIKGMLNNSCLSLKEVTVALTEGNVYDVLPIMNLASANCKPAQTPFEVTVALPNFPTPPTLINVRSMGGQSVEKIIEIDNPLPMIF